jgi:hypothetical protein
MNGDKLWRIANGVGMVVGIGLLLAWAGLTYWSQLPAFSQPMLYNAFFPDTKGTSVRYYTGNVFASYDTTTGKTKQLTPIDSPNIENVSEVHWLDSGVIFTVQSVTPWGVLNSRMPEISIDYEQEIDTPANYWYQSFATGELSTVPVDQQPLPPVLTSGNTAVFYSAGALWQIKGEGTARQLFELEKDPDTSIAPLYTNDTAVYYLEYSTRSSTLKRYDTSTKASLTIAALPSAITNIRMMDAKTVAYTYVNGATTNLELRDTTKSDGEKTVITDFSGALNVSQDTIYVMHYYTDTIEIASVDGISLQQILRVNDLGSLPSYANCQDDTCIVGDLYGILRIASRDAAKLAAIKPGYHDPLDKAVQNDNIALSRQLINQSDNTYLATFVSGNTHQRYLELRKLISDKGVDPNMVSIILNPGMRAEFQWSE